MGVVEVSPIVLVAAPALAVAMLSFVLIRRRLELRAFERTHRDRLAAKERGSHTARLQYPDIDLSKCVGCGACVRACPEEGVLDLLHGQAVVVHGARCVGHGRCAEACPTGGIALTLGDLSERGDLPAIDDNLQAVGVPGLFIAGELSGFALVRTAITHGSSVADTVAKSLAVKEPNTPTATCADEDHQLDLIIVGAGPSGIACALRAKELGLAFTVIEQAEHIGGTVAAYPRRKMVMTQPVDLPLHGRLPRLEYQKEELIALWQDMVSSHELPVQTGTRVSSIEHHADSRFVLDTTAGPMRARHICLALGRRGTPRKLGIPGEDLPNVAFSLIDAESYKDRRIVVVGGGDSAIEAALALAEQDGNEVTIVYRKKAFVRLKAKNESRIDDAIAHGRVRAMMACEPTAITTDEATIRESDGREHTIPNDDVFIFAGGEPPFSLLKHAGVSFDPADRPTEQAPATSEGTILVAGLMFLASAAGMIAWALWNHAYYWHPVELRPDLPAHDWLRPTGAIGLTFGVLSCVLFACNLTYLVRRSARFGRLLPGSLSMWMESHIFTGLFSLLCVLVHAGFTFRNAVGGHALIALFIVVTSGLIGRYLYAFVPHAANGKELDLEDLRRRLGSLTAEWDRRSRGFGASVRARIDELVDQGRWRGGLPVRIARILRAQIRLRSTLTKIRSDARAAGIGREELDEVISLARMAHRLTMQITHYEEIRSVLSSWRYIHRWLALLLVVFTVIHVVTGVRYGKFL